MGRGFDSVQDKQQRDNLRETDIFEMYQLSKKAEGNYVSLRFLPGDLLPVKKHWIKILGGKDKDKVVTIPRMCVSFNPDNQSEPLKGRVCPYCKIEHGNDDTGAPARVDFKWLSQAIIRDEQENKPRKLKPLTSKEKKTGKKERSSDSWTPVQVVALTPGVARKIKEFGDRNFHMVKNKKTGKKEKTSFPVDHPKYGIDIDIKYSPKAPGSEKYSVDKGTHTPLTEEELAYLTWDFDNWEEVYDLLGRLDSAGALADFQKMDVLGQTSEADDDEDEDDDDGMSLGKKKKGKGKSDKKKKRLLDDDEDDEDEDDEDDDDEPKSKKSKKSKSTKSKRLLDDDEDDDDDEDEKPKKKKKSSDKGKSKKSKRLLDDDEDDEDEDEKPKKKKKSSDKSSSVKKKKKKSSDDDDEDDAPKKKKKKK